ncbi:hypothetical protein PYCC9005_001880 [Savitreella phatthalungensis]
MAGGGHFAAAVISITKSNAQYCKILASKSVHRYTTRRKQGGTQSSNDNAKGAANSAGAQIRRQNEAMLRTDVASVFKDWANLLEQVELIFVRAGGPASRKLLFDNGLSSGDPRLRRIPITTKRAKQSEIIRCFHTLTKLRVEETENTCGRDPAEKATSDGATQEENRLAGGACDIGVVAEPDPAAIDWSRDIVMLIKKDKAPALRRLMDRLDIKANDSLQPARIFRHTPTLLHYAAHAGAHQTVSALLDAGADPTCLNAELQTAFEVTDDRRTRETFRIWRGHPGHDVRWDWDAARVPAALSQEKAALMRVKQASEVERHRKEELARRDAALAKFTADECKPHAASSSEQPRTGLSKSHTDRHLQLDGVDPTIKKQIERERRARAAETRAAKR